MKIRYLAFLLPLYSCHANEQNEIIEIVELKNNTEIHLPEDPPLRYLSEENQKKRFRRELFFINGYKERSKLTDKKIDSTINKLSQKYINDFDLISFYFLKKNRKLKMANDYTTTELIEIFCPTSCVNIAFFKDGIKTYHVSINDGIIEYDYVHNKIKHEIYE